MRWTCSFSRASAVTGTGSGTQCHGILCRWVRWHQQKNMGQQVYAVRHCFAIQLTLLISSATDCKVIFAQPHQMTSACVVFPRCRVANATVLSLPMDNNRTRREWNERNSETYKLVCSSERQLWQAQVRWHWQKKITAKPCMKSLCNNVCNQNIVLHGIKPNINYMHASVITYNALHWWHTNPSAWIKKSRPCERDFFGGDNRTRTCDLMYVKHAL